MKSPHTPPRLWAGQLLHIGCLIPLVALTWVGWEYLGNPSPVLFWIAIAIPMVHQLFVWLAWRLELGSSAVTKTIGFRAYLALFFILLISRAILLVALAWFDQNSLGLPGIPRMILTIFAGLMAGYTFFSIKKYFGFTRAAGADHFSPEYRAMPLVKEGIFRFSGNGMYLFGFLMFWAIAIGFDSAAALVVAGFSHIYIWVHFFATEKPDMDYLYAATK